MEERLFDDFKAPKPADWRDHIISELKGKPIEELNWSVGGIEGKPFYTKEDLPDELPQMQVANEQALELGSRNWVNYQVIQVEDEKMANEKALHALNSGANGLLFQVNKLVNFELLLKDVLLPFCSIGFEVKNDANALVQAFENYVAQNDIKPTEVRGFIRSSGDTQLSKLPNFRVLFSETKHDDAPKSLAILLANCIDRLDENSANEQEAAKWLKQSLFNLNLGESYFLEIARHRALRLLIQQLAKSYQLDLALEEIQILSTSGQWNEPTKDEYNYLLRASTQAMAAITGGTNALVINPFHKLFEKNPAQGERIARNISTILKDESYLDKALDPSAGSFYIESLTAQIMEKAWAYLQQIESQGGLKKLSENEIEALTI